MIHSKNHNNKISCDGALNPNRAKVGVNGFTIVEVIMTAAITALVLTPIFIMHGMILQRVNRGSKAFDAIIYCKSLLCEARQKQDPEAQDFTLEKPVAEFDTT